MQAAVYGLYHMTDPEVFYNREDLWTVAAESDSSSGNASSRAGDGAELRADAAAGRGQSLEFVEILPFTPANRNNLIGWIAGRSDGDALRHAVVYDFPKTKLVDGPLQVEARIDQNAAVVGPVVALEPAGIARRRGGAARDPDRQGRCSTPSRSTCRPSRARCRSCASSSWRCRTGWLRPDVRAGARRPLRQRESTLTPRRDRRNRRRRCPAVGAGRLSRRTAPPGAASAPPTDVNALIAAAAQDLEAYQRLTAAGRLGEAGQRLEALKQKLDELARRQ